MHKRNLDRNKHLNGDHFNAFNELKTIQNGKDKNEEAHVVSNIVRHRIKYVCMRHVKGLSLCNTVYIVA